MLHRGFFFLFFYVGAALLLPISWSDDGHSSGRNISTRLSFYL
jgi:hypothetical protein